MTYISVVIPFRGSEPWIAQCVDSLFVQRYPSWRREFIFVDNGGAAESRAVIERHPSVRLLEAPEPGVFAARNLGVQSARGEVIAFTDADCAVAPDWLDSIAKSMADPAVRMVLGSYRPARASFATSVLAAYENEKNRYIFGGADERLYHGYANNMAVRAEVFDEVGPFPLRLRGSDAILARKVVARYGRDAVRFAPAMAVRHLQIRGALDYYRKEYVHSRSLRALKSVTELRPLDLHERLDVFSRTVKTERKSLAAAGAFFLLLAGGMAVWKAGSLARPQDGEPAAMVGDPTERGAVGRSAGASPDRSGKNTEWKEAI